MMAAINDIERACNALHFIPPDLPREDWVKAGMGAKAAGLDFDAFNDWSAGAGNYDERAARDAWRSFKPGPIGAGTLFRMAREHGWRDDAPRQRPTDAEVATRRAEQARRAEQQAADDAARHAAAAERATVLWDAAAPADNTHAYLQDKGVPAYGLRVGSWPCIDPETGEVFTSPDCLLIPVLDRQKKLHSLQAIEPCGRKWLLAGGASSSMRCSWVTRS